MTEDVFLKHNLKLIKEDKNKKCICETHEGYIVTVYKYNLNKCKTFNIFKNNEFSKINLKIWADINKLDIEYISGDLKGKRSKLKWKCLKCDTIFYNSVANIEINSFKCGYCENPNLIQHKAIWMLDYLKHKEDANMYNVNSKNVVDIICPICGSEYKRSVFNMYNCGTGCPCCTKVNSKSEKILYNILSQINEQFEYHKKFKWSNGKIYDFYIPKYDLIIELHGRQHYEDSYSFTKKSLSDEQRNDKYKRNLAHENGIKLYISIDCSNTKFENLIQQFKINLNSYFNFNFLNLDEVLKMVNGGEMYGLLKHWNDNSKYITVRQLANKFNLSYDKTLNLLKEYSERGLCEYNSDIEILKNSRLKSKKVYSYDFKTGNLKHTYESIKETYKKLGLTVTELKTILCRNDNKDGLILKLYKTNNIYNDIEDYMYKGVERIDKGGEIIFYESLKDATINNLGLNINIIRSCCTTNKIYNNFLWRYKYYSKLEKEKDNYGNIY